MTTDQIVQFLMLVPIAGFFWLVLIVTAFLVYKIIKENL